MKPLNVTSLLDAVSAVAKRALDSTSTIHTPRAQSEAYFAPGVIEGSLSSATTQSSLNAQQNISEARQQVWQEFSGLGFPADAAQNDTARQYADYATLAQQRRLFDLMVARYLELTSPPRVTPEPAERVPFTTKPEVPF